MTPPRTGNHAAMTITLTRLQDAARSETREYCADEERPLSGHLVTMGTYGGVVAALSLTARLTSRRLPERLSPADIGVVAAATYKLSRPVAKAPVISPLRAPFTEFEGPSGAAELAEKPRGSGHRHAIGELLTCPLCVSQWVVATGLVAGLVFAPRAARLVAGTFAALAGADLLQFARARAEQATG